MEKVTQLVKNVPANAGDTRNSDSIPGLGKSPEGGHGNPHQYSWLENPMDRGAWQSIGLQSQTRLSVRACAHTHTHTHTHTYTLAYTYTSVNFVNITQRNTWRHY